MNNIIENNKLIAEFMGWKENKDMEVKLTSGGITYYFQKNDEACIPETMCYHSDWNWLMSVVEKINTIDEDRFTVQIFSMDTYIYDSKDRNFIIKTELIYNPDELIKSVYNTCVEFIKWYNEQNKNNEKHTYIINRYYK